MKNQIVFAVVSEFRLNREDSGKSYGFAVTPEGQEFYLPMWACHKIWAGPTEPEFGHDECRQWARQEDRVVLIPDKRETKPGQKPIAYRWGYRRYWDRALVEIKDRLMYQVRGENRFKGQKMNGERREDIVIDCATAEELQFRFPRGSTNDPLGTEEPYRSGPCQRINRWFKWEGADWKLCADPRPMSDRQTAVLARELASSGSTGNAVDRLDAELEKLAASTGGRNRGANNTEKRRQAVTA